ncbi:3-carboxyethylcatechol 2,3-dioxygenase, partial [Actinomadura sp. GC306]|uniref:3-carboxyethylcatechol 2,3-dioxygenase n=1 Tax=Actinomadura sp. GC306 TaxID=2530367 RepID=UPI0010533127
MTLALLATSHSPLLEHADLPAELTAELDAAFAEARRFVRDFDPDLIVSIAPDHYNGFFYRLMPPFCIGYAAESIGDYGSRAGRLDVPEDLARGLAEAVLDDGIDVAVSLDMQVDHGAVQPLEIVYGDIAAKPVVPVFVNSVAPPFTPLRRVRLLGESIGRHLGGLAGRVLLISSGGLSHDPPVPTLATATAEQRRMLLGQAVPLPPEARAARQQRVIDTARDFAAGTAAIQDLAPEWDRELLRVLASGDLTPLDSWTPAEMARAAGNSAHEVRTWIAGYAALGAAGPYSVRYRYYRPIRELIAGFAVTTAAPACRCRPR